MLLVNLQLSMDAFLSLKLRLALGVEGLKAKRLQMGEPPKTG